ncbi:hypothetical protein [Auritidibacter ignavus]|uniref:hypothetical protein n=1 Tax=Auritidibacter ignavus TaxID=678932 RepID=UPI000F0210FC|nr:hypothetical protein [Auritidibacter ignavus]NIH70512.1 putative nucleic acid-binding Zn-ribbon protein [Auritidibacter ignavus]RMX23299.1 hypothetical protein DYI20_05385 [Auritidibacter ignavus]
MTYVYGATGNSPERHHIQQLQRELQHTRQVAEQKLREYEARARRAEAKAKKAYDLAGKEKAELQEQVDRLKQKHLTRYRRDAREMQKLEEQNRKLSDQVDALKTKPTGPYQADLIELLQTENRKLHQRVLSAQARAHRTTHRLRDTA